ncbi:MAG: hypothetical protein R3B99_32340 [Polyangiales bacterium]
MLERLDFAAETQSLPGTAAVIQARAARPAGHRLRRLRLRAGVKLVAIAPSPDAPAVVPDEVERD